MQLALHYRHPRFVLLSGLCIVQHGSGFCDFQRGLQLPDPLIQINGLQMQRIGVNFFCRLQMQAVLCRCLQCFSRLPDRAFDHAIFRIGRHGVGFAAAQSVDGRTARAKHQTGNRTACNVGQQFRGRKSGVGILGCFVCHPVEQIGKAFLGSFHAGLLEDVYQRSLAAGFHHVKQIVYAHLFRGCFDRAADRASRQRRRCIDALVRQIVNLSGVDLCTHDHTGQHRIDQTQRHHRGVVRQRQRLFCQKPLASGESFQRLSPCFLSHVQHLIAQAVFGHARLRLLEVHGLLTEIV